MASIKKMRKKWYSRIRTTKNGRREEKLIPLLTENETDALARNDKVNLVEKRIRSGHDFEFPWQKETGGQTTLKQLLLSDAVDGWIQRRKKRPDIRPNTIAINLNGIDHLYRCLGKKIPLKSITTNQMDEFSDYLADEGLSNTTINIHLRTMKAFFRYCWKREMIDRPPMIEQIAVEDSLPIYITDDEFQAVIDEVGTDSFYGRVFFFYRETGVRLCEPFIAALDRSWLDIPNTSKGKRPRSIELNEFLIDTFKELQDWSDNCGLVEESKGRHISKKFKKCLRKNNVSELKHLHCLRHTFAVRNLVMGVPLAMISTMMGHRSQATTEVYTKFDMKRLKNDFRTLVTAFSEDEIKSQKVMSHVSGDTEKGDTLHSYGTYMPIYGRLES